MSEYSFNLISSQIDMLSYSERVRLLDKIVRTLHVPAARSVQKNGTDFSAAFGLWKDREISVESIRANAWERT